MESNIWQYVYVNNKYWPQFHNNLIQVNYNPKYFQQNYTFFSQVY